MAYTRVNWKNYPSTDTPTNATNLNVMDAGISNVDTRLTTSEGEIDTAQTDIDNLQTGWNVAGETWTYSSVDNPTGVITITGDKTTKYSLGMRIKFTNNSNVIYGIITKISYSSPNTTLTFLHEINPANSLALHLMANSAITNNYYSTMKVPYGFPLEENKWTVKVSLSTNYFKASPAQNTIYYTGFSLTVPIGCWELSFSSIAYADRGSSGTTQCSLGLASNQTTLDLFLSIQQTLDYSSGVTGTLLILPINPKRLINLSSKTTYYQNIKTTATGIGSIGSVSEGETYIKAVCAYL